MTTKGKREFLYGKIEARIKIPVGQGLWPAFWMLGANIDQVDWPACGEIDIMEHINTDSLLYGTLHWDNNGHVQKETTLLSRLLIIMCMLWNGIQLLFAGIWMEEIS